MSLTATLTDVDTGEPVAYRAIKIDFSGPFGNLDVITDKNGQFTIDDKYRNHEFRLTTKYYECREHRWGSGQSERDSSQERWRNWEGDTLNIPVWWSSGVEPRSLGAGITVALKILSKAENYITRTPLMEGFDYRYGFMECALDIPNPIEIEIGLRLVRDGKSVAYDSIKVTTDRNGMFLIDEKYRNFDCYSSLSYLRSDSVKLDDNYVEMGLEVIPIIVDKWLIVLDKWYLDEE